MIFPMENTTCIDYKQIHYFLLSFHYTWLSTFKVLNWHINMALMVQELVDEKTFRDPAMDKSKHILIFLTNILLFKC